MKNLARARAAVAAVALTAADLARAGGDATGTEAVGQMEISGGTFALMVGGLVGLGLVIWVLTKFLAK